jgi:hypothetical protein
MTDTFLKTKKKNPSGQQPDVSTKQKQQQDYAQKMISIMKEMQSPRKFNSPLRRRNFFAAKQLPLPIRQGDTIIQGVPIQITCNEYLDGVDALSGVDPPTSTKHANAA